MGSICLLQNVRNLVADKIVKRLTCASRSSLSVLMTSATKSRVRSSSLMIVADSDPRALSWFIARRSSAFCCWSSRFLISVLVHGFRGSASCQLLPCAGITNVRKCSAKTIPSFVGISICSSSSKASGTWCGRKERRTLSYSEVPTIASSRSDAALDSRGQIPCLYQCRIA